MCRITVLGVIVFVLVSCTSISAERTVINDIDSTEAKSFVVRALDPDSESSIEYRALAAAFTQSLINEGFDTTTYQPDLVFLLGYALEIGIDAPWERTMIVIGYDTRSRQRVYEAKLVSEGDSDDVVTVGASILASIAEQMTTPGIVQDHAVLYSALHDGLY